MKREKPQVVQLGDLVVAVFDAAARLVRDPKDASRLAIETVWRLTRTHDGDARGTREWPRIRSQELS